MGLRKAAYDYDDDADGAHDVDDDDIGDDGDDDDNDNGDDDIDGEKTYRKRSAQSLASSRHHSWAGPHVQLCS